MSVWLQEDSRFGLSNYHLHATSLNHLNSIVSILRSKGINYIFRDNKFYILDEQSAYVAQKYIQEFNEEKEKYLEQMEQKRLQNSSSDIDKLTNRIEQLLLRCKELSKEMEEKLKEISELTSRKYEEKSPENPE